MKIMLLAIVAIGLIACNSSKQLHTSAVAQDSTVKAGKDSFSASSSRTDNSEDYEKLTSMLYDLKETVDEQGNRVTQPYMKEVRYYEKASKKSSEEKHDSTHILDTSMLAVTRRLDEIDKKSSTQVLPGWLYAALGSFALVLVLVFVVIIYLHKRQSKNLHTILATIANKLPLNTA